MLNKLYLIFVILLLFQNRSQGQDRQLMFYEIINNDSVMMFFSRRNTFVEKMCSEFIRYIRIDSEGNFNGYFKDLNRENLLLGKGLYAHGKKHGYFEIYYPNGKISCRGNYLNNIPVGQWDFFYEDQSPERTIRFTEKDTLLLRFVDNKGNLKVNEGIGEFNGYVNQLPSGPNPTGALMAKGKILDGKPDGKWTSSLHNNKTFECKEEFDRGRLIRGTFPIRGTQDYHNGSFLNKLFPESYLSYLEGFIIEKCADPPAIVFEKHSREKYGFNFQKFNSDLRTRIDRVIENDFRTGNTQDYIIGDNSLTMQFSGNKEGKAENFVLLTGWGQHFFDAIATSIRMQTKFPSFPETMYFHLKLHYPGGFTYQYSFYFSGN